MKAMHWNITLHFYLAFRIATLSGLGLISVAVLLCLVLWILYANRSGSEEVFVKLSLSEKLKNRFSKNRISTTTSLSYENSQDVCYKDVFIASFAELPGLLLSAVAVDKVGRKLSMSIMFFMCCIFPLPLIFHLPKGLTTGLLFRARICITTTFTIMYIYAPEIYPTSVRTTGMGTASSMARIGGMLL